MIEIASIGGYNEVGKNMTAVKVDDEVIILDVGLYLPAVVGFEDEQNFLSSDELIEYGAIPDDNKIKDCWSKIKGVVISHCHLDHSGAAPYLVNKYNSPVFGTPFTIEVLKRILRDKDIKLNNKLTSVELGKRFNITKNIECELVNVTHSTLQTAIVVLFTKYGNIAYANDFKLDETPTLGKVTNYETLKKLENVKIAIMDSLYSEAKEKTPSENIAKEMLKDILLNNDHKGKLIVVTTFSSHLARLKSIAEFGKKMNRKVVFLGRSLNKYVEPGENLNLVQYDVESIFWPRKIAKKLKEIEKEGRGKYLIVCTGNQGEPKSVLSKLVNKTFQFEFMPNDVVVFSCHVIPTEISINNRRLMEEKLEKYKVKIYRDIHQSGHGSGEDMKTLINLLRPVHIIPTHGDHDKLIHLSNIATELGYIFGKTVHLLNDGDRLKIE